MPAKLRVLIGRQHETKEIIQLLAKDDGELPPYLALCKSSPQAIVQILRLEEPTLPEGALDGEPNFSLALFAVVNELVSGLSAGKPKEEMKTWNSLVNAGVIDAVAELVADPTLVPEVDIVVPGYDPANLDPEVEEEIKHVLQAPWFPALQLLWDASDAVSSGRPSPQDVKFLSSVRAKWSRMMERIWNEPFNSLRPEGRKHVGERMAPVMLVQFFMSADPSIMSEALKDRTIPVLMRNWAHSGVFPEDLFDAYHNTIILNELIRPTIPELQRYIMRHPELGSGQAFTQMCRGVSPSPDSSQEEQIDALLTAFGSRLEIFNGLEAEMTTQLILSMLNESNLGPLRTRAITHVEFWSGWYSLLRRTYTGEAKGSTKEPTTKPTMLRALTAMQMIAYTISPALRRQLVCTCVRAGLLDTLEEIIDVLVDMNRTNFIRDNMDVCEPLAAVFHFIFRAATAGDDETKALLKDQFPRWRILQTLLVFDIKNGATWSMVTPPQLSIAPSVPHSRFAWQAFAHTQVVCRPQSLCSRRGCQETGTSKCSVCKAVLYCGPECQKLDWKGHRGLCTKGLMERITNLGPPNIYYYED